MISPHQTAEDTKVKQHNQHYHTVPIILQAHLQLMHGFVQAHLQWMHGLVHSTGQQSTLLELLDAPQLMDTCVRNGIFDEALDLHAFIMRVGLLHPDLPVVKLLASQVSWMASLRVAVTPAG